MDAILLNGDGRRPDGGELGGSIARALAERLAGRRPMQHADLSRPDQSPEAIRRTTTEAVELLLSRGVSPRRITVAVAWGGPGRRERATARGRFIRDGEIRRALTPDARAMAAQECLEAILGLQDHLARHGIRQIHWLTRSAHVARTRGATPGLEWLERAIDWRGFLPGEGGPLVLEDWARARGFEDVVAGRWTETARDAFLDGVLLPFVRGEARPALRHAIS